MIKYPDIGGKYTEEFIDINFPVFKSLCLKMIETDETDSNGNKLYQIVIDPKAGSGGGGEPGPAGKDGSKWYNGEGAPGTQVGVDGDYYLDSTTGGVYQKQSGVWVTVANIMGPKGDKGSTGATGQGVPAGGTAGQVLTKKSNTSYDTEWKNSSGGLEYRKVGTVDELPNDVNEGTLCRVTSTLAPEFTKLSVTNPRFDGEIKSLFVEEFIYSISNNKYYTVAGPNGLIDPGSPITYNIYYSEDLTTWTKITDFVVKQSRFHINNGLIAYQDTNNKIHIIYNGGTDDTSGLLEQNIEIHDIIINTQDNTFEDVLVGTTYDNQFIGIAYGRARTAPYALYLLTKTSDKVLIYKRTSTWASSPVESEFKDYKAVSIDFEEAFGYDPRVNLLAYEDGTYKIYVMNLSTGDAFELFNVSSTNTGNCKFIQGKDEFYIQIGTDYLYISTRYNDEEHYQETQNLNDVLSSKGITGEVRGIIHDIGEDTRAELFILVYDSSIGNNKIYKKQYLSSFNIDQDQPSYIGIEIGSGQGVKYKNNNVAIIDYNDYIIKTKTYERLFIAFNDNPYDINSWKEITINSVTE